MWTLLKMAWRDLGRNRRRSFFSALALALGLGLLMLIAGVLQDEMSTAMNTSIRLDSGNIQVRAASYNQDKTSLAFEDLIAAPAGVAGQIAALEPVKAATPRLFASGILSSGDETASVRVIGIDPTSEANTPFQERVTGQFITADDLKGLMIGQALATKLDLTAGDTINLLVNTSNGSTDEQPFVIRGIYNTQTPAFDQYVVLLPLAKAQSLTQAGDHASTIFVLLKDNSQTTSVVDALKSNPNYQVKTFEQMNELLVQTEEMANSYMILIYLIVLLITATVIINTMIMAVLERTREIGILSAIGMRGGRIMAMFFAESSLLAVGGILMGLVIGVALVSYFGSVGVYVGNMGITGYMLSERIHAQLTLKDTVNLTLLTFIVSLLAALIPAVVAARMEPVDALRGK